MSQNGVGELLFFDAMKEEIENATKETELETDSIYWYN